MSGRRWTLILLATVSISAIGCQVDGRAAKIWNPFVRADRTDGMDSEQLPKFVRRVKDDDDKSKESESPITESRVEALLAEGQRSLQENRIPEARRAYNEVLQLLPDDPTAHHGLAMAADLTENWAEAEDHYRQALRARPRDANLLCDIGYSYLLQNRYSEAASYLAQAVQINPDHENAHANLALLDVRQGNREAARKRLTQLYGDPANVARILASLESTCSPSAKTAESLTSTAPAIPDNASFETIRKILDSERIAGEQRRAAGQVPVDHNPAVRPVSANSPEGVPGHDQTAPYGLAQRAGHFAGPITDPTAAGNYATETHMAGIQAPGSNPANTGEQMPILVPAQFGSPPAMMTSRSNAIAANEPPAANPVPPDPINSQQFAAANNQIPSAVSTPADPSGVITVRPSGSFQPPTSGVSYGQPFGFGQSPVNTAGYQGNTSAGLANGQLSGNAIPGNAYSSPAANLTGQPNSHLARQHQNTGQYSSQVQFEGLNVGPGSLFPIGQGSDAQGGQLRMGNVSPPGTNSVINGAMYGQPLSTLPSQEWMMQQQSQQMGTQPQQFSQNGQGHSDQNYYSQGYSNTQYSGNPQNSDRSGMPIQNVGTSAPRPGNQPQPTSPLSSYENQLRQLDNQYNNTLKQLDRNTTATVPRAQY